MSSRIATSEEAMVKTLMRPAFAVTLGALGATLLAFAITSAQSDQPGQPSGVSIVLNEGGDSLVIIDSEDGRVLAEPDSGTVLHQPHLAAFDTASHRLYVGNKGGNLAVFDMTQPLAPKVVANMTPGGDGEIHSVVLAAGLIWLAHEGDSAIYAYDPANLDAPAVTLDADQGFDSPHGLTLRPKSDELWVTNRPEDAPGFVLRIDTRSRSVVGAPLETTSRPGDRPNNTAFAPDGRRAYVVNNGSGATQVTVIDAASFAVVSQIEQDAKQGLAPHAIAFEPETKRLFVSNKDGGTVSVIDTETDTVVGYVAVGEEPHCLTLGPDGRIYATVKQDNAVVMIDPRTLAITHSIVDPALSHPHQAVFIGATAGGTQDLQMTS
jgi:YVTN family beta-propeller protein